MSHIREELLLKAKRDLSKLVKVQRMVSRGGKTFPQYFYVQPSQVKSSDKVVGGQNNLTNYLNPKVVPAPAKGVLDSAYFDYIKSDKKKALDYLKSCGIQWTECANSAAINWMRATQAYHAALNGQNATNTSNQVNAQAPNSKQQKGQTPQSGAYTSVTLTSTQQDEVNTGKNGREKVIILKKLLGKEGTMNYARTLGVTWNENAHDAINHMQMSMALAKYFDEIDGTTSPTKSNKPQGNVGAPNGNQNAKKDGSSKSNDKDKLKIPDNATEREKNIINLINSIDNEDDLKLYTSVGMIAEDDVSKSFIQEKLAPKYEAFKSDHGKKKKKTTQRFNPNTSSGFGDEMSYLFNFQGCKKSVIKHGYRTLYERFHMGLLVDPRRFYTTDLNRRGRQQVQISSIIETLQKAYCTYTTDDYKGKGDRPMYLTNLGYDGWDNSEYKKNYNRDNDGFIKVLNKIGEDNTNLKEKCEELTGIYEQMMNLVDYNPKLLTYVLECYDHHDKAEDTEELEYDAYEAWSSTQYFSYIYKCKEQLDHYLEVIDKQAEIIPKILESKGFSKEQIADSLRGYYSNDLDNFRVAYKDSVTGFRKEHIIDLTKEIDPVTGSPYLKEDEKKMCDSALSYVYMKYTGDFEYRPELMDKYKQLKALSEVTDSKIMQVQELATKLFGLQYKDSDGNEIPITHGITPKQLHRMTHDTNSNTNVSLTKIPQNDDSLDTILSNLNMYKLTHEMNSNTAYYVKQNARNAVNHYGLDYSKNFDYYSVDSVRYLRTTNKRFKSSYDDYYSAFTYSKDALNSQIDKQLSRVSGVSSEYVNNLKDYYTQFAIDLDSGEDYSDVARRMDFNEYGIKFEDYLNNPMKDILFNMSMNMAQGVSTMAEKGVSNLQKNFQKRMDYVPFDFNSDEQPRFNKKKAVKKPTTSSLLTLRKGLFKSANCTVEVEDEATSLEMRKEFLKNWDYDGVTHKKLYSGANSHMGADRRALFNSRFFKIKNSNMEQPFKDYCSKLNQTPEEHYHATSYGSTAGILGVTGGWNVGKGGYTKVAKALGPGAYFGKKGGKSSVYCGEGDGGYHDLYSSGAQGDNANGCYILTSVIPGTSSDSTVCNSFREYEIVVRNNECLLPHHMVDISCRSLGVNVKRDSTGNYLDMDGNITHDKYGKKIDMK